MRWRRAEPKSSCTIRCRCSCVGEFDAKLIGSGAALGKAGAVFFGIAESHRMLGHTFEVLDDEAVKP